MPTFVGKLKGPWRFCTFCSEPMGTKSHISKALPGSIMTKGIGLIVLQRATFRAGCVYLNFPLHFLYVFQQFLANSCIQNEAEEIQRLSASDFGLIQCYFVGKHRSVDLVFMFAKNPSAMEVLRLCSKLCLLVFLSKTLRLLLSISLRTFGIENPWVWMWAFSSIFHMHYETQLIKLQVNAMTRPPSICNTFLFSSVFSYSVCRFRGFSGGWIRLYACFKA